MLRITQIASIIARNKHQRKVLVGLGLHGINKSVLRKSDSSILGMINKIKHLVKIEQV